MRINKSLRAYTKGLMAPSPAHGLERKTHIHHYNALPPQGKSWVEDDIMGGERVRAMVVVLKTRGCYWYMKGGGCFMCGYNLANAGPRIEVGEQLKAHLQRQYGGAGKNGFPLIKIFNSGSFFNPSEMDSEKGIREVINTLASLEGLEEVVIESRPEFISEKALGYIEPLLDSGICVKIAFGLETASDFVRVNSVNKGLMLEDYERAFRIINDWKGRNEGLTIKLYLLLKPPFLTEWEAIDDAIKSINYGVKWSDDISINPVNLQRGSGLYRIRRFYRPPYLWSLLYVLLQTVHLRRDGAVRIYSSPTGAGSRMGIHNCGRCDRKVIEAIRRLSFDYYALEDTNAINETVELSRALLDEGCNCLKEWYALKDSEFLVRYRPHN